MATEKKITNIIADVKMIMILLLLLMIIIPLSIIVFTSLLLKRIAGK